MLEPEKNDEDDFATYAAVVNKHFDEFKLSELTADNFKYLVFSQGLTSGRDAEITRRVLSKLESERSLTHQKHTEDCQKTEIIKKRL